MLVKCTVFVGKLTNRRQIRLVHIHWKLNHEADVYNVGYSRLSGSRRSADLSEVEEAPGDDGVVVEGDVEGDDGAADADPAQQRRHLVPDADGAFPQALPDRQLQVEDGDPLAGQHHEVGDQEGPCQQSATYKPVTKMSTAIFFFNNRIRRFTLTRILSRGPQSGATVATLINTLDN